MHMYTHIYIINQTIESLMGMSKNYRTHPSRHALEELVDVGGVVRLQLLVPRPKARRPIFRVLWAYFFGGWMFGYFYYLGGGGYFGWVGCSVQLL